jgi:hypothetical protein
MLEFVKNIEFLDEVKPKLEIKDEPIEPKKEIGNECQGKIVKIESKKDDSILEFVKDIEFSDEVKPKIEIKDEL